MFKTLLLSASTAAFLASGAMANSPVKIAELSGRLFEIGIAQKDATLVMAASKLRRSLELEQVDRAPVDKAAREDAADIQSWQSMLRYAKEFASDDEALLGVIEDFEAENSKGVSTGQVYSISKIRSGGTDTYAGISYTGGDYAEVYIEGKTQTDLNVRILDDKNRLVCSDTDISNIAYCGWRPRATASFSIVVENKGNASVSYSLITN